MDPDTHYLSLCGRDSGVRRASVPPRPRGEWAVDGRCVCRENGPSVPQGSWCRRDTNIIFKRGNPYVKSSVNKPRPHPSFRSDSRTPTTTGRGSGFRMGSLSFRTQSFGTSSGASRV